MKLFYRIIGFMTLCAINIAALIYCWTSILLTPIPAIVIGMSFLCSLLFLFEPKTKALAVFTYMSLAFIALLGLAFTIYSRRPIGFLVSFSAVAVICKNFLTSRKYWKKDRLRTKMITGVCLISAFALVGCTVYHFVLNKRHGLSNGQDTMWGAECVPVFDAICAEASTDEDVAYAAYDWIRTNMTYDHDLNFKYQYFDCRNTLTTKTGVCFDFANLFTAICRSHGVPCFCIDGNSKRKPSSKHSFNRVFFNGSWWTVDVTYDTEFKGKLWGFHKCQSLSDPDEDYYITKIY